MVHQRPACLRQTQVCSPLYVRTPVQRWRSTSPAMVEPTITTYMHIVSTEASVMIMNYFQNKPQIRMQLMRSPANGTPSPEQRRIQNYFCRLLRIRIKPQQLLLHPDDEQDLFGREEALRMDEEIVNFLWFDNVTWDSIKDLRVATYGQPPPRFKFALQQAQHAILRTTIHNNPSSLASEPALAGSFWDDMQSMPLRAVAHTFGMHDWNSFGLRTGQHFGPRFALNVISLQYRMSHAEQTRSRSSYVYAKSLHWHVLVKKDEPKQLPEPHHQFQSQNRLFKRLRVSTPLTQNPQLLRRPIPVRSG